jgi:hypothetical protein
MEDVTDQESKIKSVSGRPSTELTFGNPVAWQRRRGGRGAHHDAATAYLTVGTDSRKCSAADFFAPTISVQPGNPTY